MSKSGVKCSGLVVRCNNCKKRVDLDEAYRKSQVRDDREVICPYCGERVGVIQ